MFDTIVCISVLNVLSKNNRTKTITKIQNLLTEEGIAYLAVPRDLPITGKLGINHSPLNYVILTLDSIYSDPKIEIYKLTKTSKFKDKTTDFLTPRDKRILRG